MNRAGLILAAGESRRMGSPKALLPYRGRTFLDTLIALLAERCETVIAVLGAPFEWRRPAGVHVVMNENYRTGQTSSLQAGLREVPADAEGVLFTLVDHPAVSLSTIDALLAAPRPLIRIPRYNDERGHPIWFSRDLIPEFLAVPLDAAANTVTRAHRAETEFLDLDDPGITADIDTPEAYRALLVEADECA